MPRDSGITIGGRSLSAVSLRRSLLVVLVGLGAGGFGVYDYVQQNQAVENAVEVDATVVETGVDASSSRRGGPDYSPEATFEYSYQGESYTGNSVFPGSITKDYDTRSAAESVLEDYQAGETVAAYVDPNSPSDAFLVNETSNSPLFFTAIGGLFVLVGGYSALRSLVGR
ncbi:DUF3592 domain-containing protein [Halorussus halobius]|uniref:DUF3592 domain-containing protein n=1 Tax=Halorussus halobius TaxID=1710537 RepID=UPI001092466A|nr:DUF3592 domain-containing protein [Halorussus halobius]